MAGADKKNRVPFISQRIKTLGWAITLFPEDPGNYEAVAPLSPEGDDLCGDGVLGSRNLHQGDQRKDALERDTGALAFLVDGILNHGVRKVGLFGYSHGGGCVNLLMEMLARRAKDNQTLKDLLLPQFPNPPEVTFFWTAYVDGVYIAFNSTSQDATGRNVALSQFPIKKVEQDAGNRTFGRAKLKGTRFF